jgi:hypothetical protein
MFPHLLRKQICYRAFLPVFMLLLAVGISRPGHADEAPQRPLDQAALRDLLQKGWNVSLRGYDEARYQVQQLQLVTRADHRLGYARLLIEVKQRKYGEAERSLEALLRQYPNYLPLWRARVWFSVLTRKHNAALAQVQQLGQLVAQGKLQTDALQGAGLVPASPDQVLEVITWTGQLVGFLEGPANTAINQVALEQRRASLLQLWNQDQRKAFEAGRQGVLGLYAGRQVVTRQLAKDAQIEVQKRLQDLDQKEQQVRKDLQQRREDLSDEKNELRNELRDQQQLWVQEDRPLTNSLWQLDGQANLAWRNRSYLLSELNWLQLQIATEVDPIVIQQLLLRIDRVNGQLYWSDNDLASLQNQSWNVQRTRGDLYRQHQQNQQLVRKQLDDSQESLESVDRKATRLDSVINRERRQAQAKSRRVRAAEAKNASLKSYLDFPLELEKIRLLNTF